MGHTLPTWQLQVEHCKGLSWDVSSLTSLQVIWKRCVPAKRAYGTKLGGTVDTLKGRAATQNDLGELKGKD